MSLYGKPSLNGSRLRKTGASAAEKQRIVLWYQSRTWTRKPKGGFVAAAWYMKNRSWHPHGIM